MELVAVNHIPLRRSDREGQVVGFFIGTRCGVQNQGSGVCGDIAGFLSGSGCISCTDDLRVFCQSAGQLHRVSKHTLRQIVVLHGEAFRLVRAADHRSFVAVYGAPGQFQIQVQHIFTFQNKGECQLLLYLFAIFTVLLNIACYLEGIVPVTVSIREFDFLAAVLGNFPECAVTGCNEYAGNFHISGIVTCQ